MRKEGYITVYLSLTIAVMLSFIVTLIEAVRVQTIRFQTECVMDIGLTSIFAEYNRELWKQYGMLAIDTSYGSAGGEDETTKAHLLEYMNMNFIAPGQVQLPNYKDLTALHADNAKLYKVSYLADNQGEVLKYQIIQYMKEQTGLVFLDAVKNAVIPGNEEQRYYELENSKNSSYGQIDEILNELNANKEEDEEEISIDNPASHVEGMRSSFLLDFAVKDSGSILRNQVSLSEYISHRSRQEGTGLWETQDSVQGSVNSLLWMQYLFQKCGYYGNEKGNSALGYQLEYLLYGNDNDFDNLDAFASQVFRLRYVTNAAYLFQSSKLNEAELLAMAVTSGIGSPQLTQAVKMTIAFAWCYAESIQDMRILFDGKKAALVKSDAAWNIALSELLMFTSGLDSYKEAPHGITYANYLAGFLMAKQEEVVRVRLMDLMEMDIRRSAGNQYFQMDHCIYQLEAEVNVSSKYGYGYSITRNYSYE